MKSIKSVFLKASCMLAFTLIANSFSKTQAQQVQAKYAAASESGSDIRFMQMENNMLVFELDLKNLPAKGTMLSITDESGNVLFEQSIKTTTYQRRYKIERNNLSKIEFKVSKRNFNLNRTFSINTWMEEKISVAKL